MVAHESRAGHDIPLQADCEIAVVAAGRLGASLAIALVKAGRKVVAVSSRRSEQRAWLRSQLANARSSRLGGSPVIRVCSNAREASASAKVVFVASSDATIAEVADSCQLTDGQYVAHCSGLLGAEVLSEGTSNAIPGAIHPLQTFPSRESHGLLNGISFGIESTDGVFLNWLEGIAYTFKGRVFRISGAHERAVYHAAAVMSCGLFAGLTGVAAELWRGFGVPRNEALEHMSPMIQSTAAAISQLGMPDALSGPFVRGDIGTVRAHLNALSTVNIDAARAYAALALAQLPLSCEKGKLNPVVATELERTLAECLESL